MLKDTIISAFNYDGTLLKWLKKVEEALQGDTLTNIEVVTNSDYSMQLKLTFGDGTFILSPSFTNKGRGIVSITKTATSGLVDTYTVTYTDNTTSTFTVTNAEGFNANNLYSTLTAGTGIELTNNGQNVTVTAKRLLNEIVDSQGRQRFIEGNLNPVELEGETVKYAKWSLSGTHLMVVFAFTMSANAEIQEQQTIFSAIFPAWVASKIRTIKDTYVDFVAITAFNTNTLGEVNLRFRVVKSGNSIIVNKRGATTFADDTYVRIELDFLIDTD